MYAIKIMSSENKADSDVGKGFKMIMVQAGDTFEFGHDQVTGYPQVTVTGDRAGEPTCVTYPVTGNCYVLSETGKTIASFWGNRKPGCQKFDIKLDPGLKDSRDVINLIQKKVSDEQKKTSEESNPDNYINGIGLGLLPNESNLNASLIDEIKERSAQLSNSGMTWSHRDNIMLMRERYSDRGLTNTQTMLLGEPKLELKNDVASRDKHYRTRVAYLMSHGIPQDIAMENSLYLTEKKPVA